MAKETAGRVYWFIAYRDPEDKKWLLDKSNYRYEESMSYQLNKVAALSFAGDTKDSCVIGAYDVKSNRLTVCVAGMSDFNGFPVAVIMPKETQLKGFTDAVAKLTKAAAIAAYADNDDPKASIKAPEVANV